MLINPKAESPLSRALRSAEGAPLGDVFSFVSSLYFRGKLSYARTFGSTIAGQPAVFVMSAGGGLCQPDERVTLERLRNWAEVSIHQDNPHFTAPLFRHASALLDSQEKAARFILLGSVASNKYVQPLLEVFADRLLFPSDFVSRGDMSRGSLLLRAVRDERELPYASVAAEVRRSRAG